MRQRTLLLLCLLMAAVSSWADKWTAMTSQDYPNEKVIYGTLTLKGVNTEEVMATIPTVELAAFIGDECRAQTILPLGETNYDLRVVGELAAGKDLNKTITLKAFYDGLTYAFNATSVFDGPDGAFLNLTLDPLVGVVLKDPIEVTGPEGDFPPYDLTNDITYIFGDGSETSSVLEDTLTLEWDDANAVGYFSVTDNTLQAVKPTPEEGVYLGLTVLGPLYMGDTGPIQFFTGAFTMVKVSILEVAVTSIELKPASITVNVGDDLSAALAAVTRTVKPDNATNKNVNWKFKEGEAEWVSPTNMAVSAAGTWHVVFYSVSNPEVTAELTVNVPVPVSFNIPESMTFYTYQDATVTMTNFVGDNFDPALVKIAAVDTLGNGDTYFKVTDVTANATAGTIVCTVKGKYVKNGNLTVSYNGVNMQVSGAPIELVPYTVNAGVVLPASGWSWISVGYVPAGQTAIVLKPDTGWIANMKNILEIRSQEQQLYNDATYGVFGKLQTLSPNDGMYKVRGKGTNPSANVIDLGGFATPASQTALSFNPNKGYNWMTYPNEFDLELSEINAQISANAKEGDKIIGQTSSAVFDETQGKWVGSSGFKFEAGKGYIYYTDEEEIEGPDFTFNGIPLCYQDVPAGAREIAVHPWKLQNQGFADNMPIVARVEELTNPEEYMVGAFIDGECRGEGRVAVRDIMLINVAGKVGDKVSFRLYNLTTEEEIMLDKTVGYTSMIGSVKKPMTFAAPVVTGITSQNVVKTQNSRTVYTLGGQRLASPRKGVNIVDGKKVVF